jgi:hypothetical protein
MGLLAPNGHIPRNYFLGYGIKLVLGGLFLYVGVRYDSADRFSRTLGANQGCNGLPTVASADSIYCRD